MTNDKLAYDKSLIDDIRIRTFDISPLPIIVLDGETHRCIDCNRAAAEMYGYESADAVIGRLPLDVSAPVQYDGTPSPEKADFHIGEAHRKGSVVFEWLHQRPDGVRWDAEVHLFSFRINGKKLLQLSLIDISDRKKTEDALRRSERQFKTLFMSITDGFYLSEILRDEAGNVHDYRYLEVNPPFERILGLPRDRIVGKRYREVVPVDTTEWLRNYCRVAETGASSTFTFYSEEYAMHFETYAYKTSENQICVFVRDVTERKKLENALQNVQKLESLGLLAGGIAHDFNNLLGGIFGYIDLASIKTQEQGTKDFLARAMGSIDRARGLTKQLLTFAKGGVPVKRRDRFVPFIQDTVRFALSGSKCSCEFAVAPDLWIGEFDRDQIGQVIDNIVINAQQAMPLGGTIEVSARNVVIAENEHTVLEAGAYVMIAVADRGIGMPKEMLPRIFDPFFTTKPAGHGLGLATSFSIVNRHGGCIDVESQQGAGSTVRIFLPALPGASAGTDAPQVKQHSGSGRILIMDDEPFILDILDEMLASFGYSVLQTASGDEAVAFFVNERQAGRAIAAMIFDLTVPGGSGGQEVIAEIRKYDPQIPVFVASGYAEDPVMAHPADYGFTASLRKPFRIQELADILGGHLQPA